MKTMTNKQFAESDSKFINACNAIGIPPTKRQASKWRRKQGLAYKTAKHLTPKN